MSRFARSSRSRRWGGTKRKSRRRLRMGRPGSLPRSRVSSGANSRCVPTNRTSATGARTRPSAARITSAMSDQLSLFGSVSVEPDADADARIFAQDPAHNVVLEASAGTGKTTVLVTRYVNLLMRGVDPANILAITFTRKAAAEMRERILRDLRRAAELNTFDRARW